LPKPHANKVGGARVSFQQLAAYLEQQNYPYQLIETQPYTGGWKKLLNPIQLLQQFLLYIGQVEVVWLNVSQGGTRLLAPLLYLLAKLFGRKFVFRPFGSSLQDDYQAYGSWQKYWFQKTALQADLLFLQTHSSIGFFTPLAKNIKHLPTSRPRPTLAENRPSFQRKFVFLGHLKASKGIDEILAAAHQLDDLYQVHLYGPIMEKQYEYLRSEGHPNYKGILKQEQLMDCLNGYDVLLLPTYFSGEGYPGAVIEAYSLGLPVITTRWRALPEIVKDGETGILIEPKNVSQLVAAIQQFNENNYPAFSAHAQQYFMENFEQTLVLEKALEEVCRGVRSEFTPQL
jgi:glycosyltransferase involved in cell wall biosynthesis